jgi:hypothetical protein
MQRVTVVRAGRSLCGWVAVTVAVRLHDASVDFDES